MNIDLSAPIWAIDHVAEAFHLTVDTAREHTYHHDFPAPRVGFARNLWLREEVLAWFAALPTRAADADQRSTNTGTVATKATKRTRRAATSRSTTSAPAPAGARPIKPYTPRNAA